MDQKCTVGIVNDEDCHMTTYTKKIGLIELLSLDIETREIIMWRSGLSIIYQNPSICYHHNYMIEKRFPMTKQTCCNPFQLHKSVRRGKLYII